MSKLKPLDTYDGPADPFTRNKGSVGRKKLVFVGASYQFVHKVLRDMLLVGGFDDMHITLHDISPEPLGVVGDLLQRIITQKKSHITLDRTLDLGEALKGADVVVLSITTGGQESDFRSVEVCAKYGIPVGVGDTLGPTALSRCLRSLPIVVNIARQMEKLCPKALMLNFTNPMSAITGAMARYSSIPCWGLCHSADALFQYFADVFGVKKEQIGLDVGGVNHQSFVTRLTVKGVDRTADILKATSQSSATFKDTLLATKEEATDLQQDVYKILGAWPSCGDDHLAEFYRFFYTPRRLAKFHRIQKIVPGRKPFGLRPLPKIIEDWAHGPRPVGDLQFLTTEHSHELMWSFLTGESYTRVLNLLNDKQYIANLPKDACVEALVTVQGRKVTGKTLTLPPAVHAIVTDWTTIHDLAIKAAMNCDRQAAMQALFLDPHVRDMYDIEPLLEDMLQATRPWLPEGWFK
jgi:alpha-galactosidase